MKKNLLITGIILLIAGFLNISADGPPGLTIYPNPVYNGNLNVSADIQIEKVEIFNIVGEVVFQQQELEPSKSVRLNFDLKSGIYLIRVTFINNTIDTKKIWVN